MEGERIGKFICGKKLGAGGMGEVWLAQDTELDRPVALKFLKGGDPSEIERFQREARIAGRLSHPNIAAIFEVGEEKGRHFIAMQFVEGRTLSRSNVSDPRTTVRQIRDAAQAVHAAHAEGIIHRDIKPENLMVTESEHLFVMDFGLARPTEGGSVHSASGLIVGTPSFMSPEQARGQRLDVRADVYSLGATLYSLLTGRSPFEGESALETLRMVEDHEAASMKGVANELQTIVFRCMEKDRDRRYANAKELAEDLTRWLSGEPIQARPPTLAYRLRKALLRRKSVVAVATAGIVAVAVVAAVLLYKGAKETEQIKQLRDLASEVDQIEQWMGQQFRDPDVVRRTLDEVLDRLDRYRKEHPEIFQAAWLRARARFMAGDLEGSEEDCHAATRIQEDFAPAWMTLVKTRLSRWREVVRNDDFLRKGAGKPKLEKTVRETLTILDRIDDWPEDNRSGKKWGLAPRNARNVDRVLVEALRDYYLEDRREEAISEVRAAAETVPSVEVYRWLAHWTRDKAETLKWLKQAIQVSPLSGVTHFELAGAFNDVADWTASLDSFGRAEDCHYRNWPLYAGRGYARLNRGIQLMARGETERARDLLHSAAEDQSRLFELGKDGYTYRFVRGTALLNLGQLDDAIDEFTRSINLKEDYLQSYLNRALAWEQKGDNRKAYDDLTRALDLEPAYFDARRHRARIMERMGDPNAAQAELTMAIRLQPETYSGYFSRGQLRMRISHRIFPTDINRAINVLREAQEDLETCLKLRPTYPDGMFALSGLHMTRMEWLLAMDKGPDADVDRMSAIALLDKYLEIVTHNGDGWLRRGTLRLNHGIYLVGRGRNAESLKFFRSAREDLDEGLRLKPNSMNGYVDRARTGEYLSLRKEAMEDYDRAVALAPSNLVPRMYRAVFYINMGKAARSRGDKTEWDEYRVRALEEVRWLLQKAPSNWLYRKRFEKYKEDLDGF